MKIKEEQEINKVEMQIWLTELSSCIARWYFEKIATRSVT